MDSLWSNLDKEDQTDQTEDDPLSSWDFQLDPDPGILIFIQFKYKRSGWKKLEA